MRFGGISRATARRRCTSPEFPADLTAWQDRALEERWRSLLEVRSAVNQALEVARQQKTIGSPLSAHVTIQASGSTADLLERYRADLPMLFITSSVDVVRTAAGELHAARGRSAAGDKCATPSEA